jgi:hypothetical protein
MDNQARDKLCQVVAKHGVGICNEPRRLRALLADYCPGLKLEVHVLATALEQRIATELLTSSTGLPWEAVSGRLVRRLMEEAAMSKQAALWAVGSWALALGKLPVECRAGTLAIQKGHAVGHTAPLAAPPRWPTSPAAAGSVEARGARRPRKRMACAIIVSCILVPLIVVFGYLAFHGLGISGVDLRGRGPEARTTLRSQETMTLDGGTVSFTIGGEEVQDRGDRVPGS